MASRASRGRGLGATTSVVADSSPLIALDRIGRGALLGALFERVFVPAAVVRKLGSAPRPSWVIERAISNPVDPRILATSLHPRERDAIALAFDIGADLLLVDELPGRRFARTLGLPLSGTVGVLLWAKQAGLLSLVRPSLEELLATGFRLGPELVVDILRQAGEAGSVTG